MPRSLQKIMAKFQKVNEHKYSKSIMANDCYKIKWKYRNKKRLKENLFIILDNINKMLKISLSKNNIWFYFNEMFISFIRHVRKRFIVKDKNKN